MPDLVPCGDVWLGGSCCGERVGNHDVCRALSAAHARSMCVRRAILSGILMRPEV